ncbi:MAG: sulfotransferase family 2 domain-containing protein [bacterium]
MVSEDKKFIFIHIPKTGGNSITTALRGYSEDNIDLTRFDGVNYNGISLRTKRGGVNKHAYLSEYEKYYNIKEYLKFSSIRNPWDKLLSWYFYHKKFEDIKNFDTFLDLIYIKKEVPKSSKNQIKWYSPQIYFLKNKSGVVCVDHVIKFENFQNDFNDLCSKLKIKKIDLLHINKSKNSEIDYREFYNEKQRDFIGEKFIEDIEYFNYKF